MTTSDKQKPQEIGQMPSMLVSWSVLAVMIVLILFSVSFYVAELVEGPFQVSMTLATLYALSVAYCYHFRYSFISEAISGSFNGTISSVFVILAIGTLIGTLFLSGSVAAFIYYGVAIINAKFFYMIVFLLAALLSMLVGSAFTTAGAVGTAFVALASKIRKKISSHPMVRYRTEGGTKKMQLRYTVLNRLIGPR